MFTEKLSAALIAALIFRQLGDARRC